MCRSAVVYCLVAKTYKHFRLSIRLPPALVINRRYNVVSTDYIPVDCMELVQLNIRLVTLYFALIIYIKCIDTPTALVITYLPH